jgi:hypothetical protein
MLPASLVVKDETSVGLCCYFFQAKNSVVFSIYSHSRSTCTIFCSNHVLIFVLMIEGLKIRAAYGCAKFELIAVDVAVSKETGT